MKKSLVTMLLMFATAAVAQQAPAGQPAPAQPAATQAQTQKKEIKDPAEYNAYVAAVQTQDPNARASALEAFLQSYPNSVMKEDGMELLVKTYQQAGNLAKVMEASDKLLQVNPNNLTALALKSAIARQEANRPNNPQAAQSLQQSADFAKRGEQALATAQKPEGLTDEQWTQLKSGLHTLFLGAIGQNALQTKDYATAQQSLNQLVAAAPNDLSSVYQLSIAYLEPKPPVVDGLFWGARAVALAQQLAPQAVAQIQPYVKNRYIRYHGSDQGFAELVAAAAQSPKLPQGFTVAPAPSPAEQAAEMLKKSAPEKLSFGEWQFILTSGNQEAAQAVWNAIKGKPLQLLVQIIDATPAKLMVAGSADDIETKTADIDLTMTAAIPKALMPKVGSQIPVQGTPDSYTVNPFMVKMIDGKLLTKAAAPAAPAKKPAAGQRSR